MKAQFLHLNRNINKHVQTGIILPITLISLLILLIASVALIRSTDTSLLIAGQIGFKRDAINQAERAIPEIRKIFDTGGALNNASLREDDVATSNYFATIQPSNSSGIPLQLLGTSFGTSNAITNDMAKISIRFLIDRMCLNKGPVTFNHCTTASSSSDVGGDALSLGEGKADGVDLPVYRISIRVTGPRNTEAFLQSTFSR